MQLEIKPMQPEERLYAYGQSQQIRGQTGSIGHLRGDFGKSGREFYTTWEDHVKSYRGEDFGDEFDKIINALRFEDVGGGLFEGRNSMRLYCKGHPESAFAGNYCEEYGFRIDKGEHSFLIRCNPMQDDYNFYVFCYVKEHLDAHMEKARNGIRFITPSYKELFRIPDGDKIQIIQPDGDKQVRVCRYIDETHVEIGSNSLYHIRQFAELMESNGNTVIPLRSSLPESCYSTLPATGELVIIRKGQRGYSPCFDFSTANEKENREFADDRNINMGVTKAQEAAMLAGSMFGWHTPAADPKNYDDIGNPIKPVKKKNRDYER